MSEMSERIFLAVNTAPLYWWEREPTEAMVNAAIAKAVVSPALKAPLAWFDMIDAAENE